MGSAPDSTPRQKRLGDFELVREIGRGGMGVVYEARQLSLDRKVALKILSGGQLTAQSVRRFHREAEAAGRLHHTNIVPIYATGEQDGTHFYAMELVEGPSLDHVLRQARVSQSETLSAGTPKGADDLTATAPFMDGGLQTAEKSAPTWTPSSLGSNAQYFDTIARLIAEVADALDYAHRQGVIHRDIKPSNLLVAPDGRLSLNDFGLARLLEQPGMTMTGEMLGTPAYMSPEQIIAGRVPVDCRTDVYSLGATLYELLTLERPFPGAQRDQVLAQIVHKEPRPPRRASNKVPIDLETICLKALEKDPDRRYQTAGAMADDLRRYVNRFAISARRVGPFTKLRKLARRHPGLAAGLACACIAIVVAAFFAFQAYRVEQQRLAERKESQAQLVAVMRERALENALVAAMGGDLDKAETAIREAETLGALAPEVRLLRGQVAYFRGDFERAAIDLEQAAKLNRDSAAARGMLALTHLMLSDWTRYEQTVRELQPLPARTDQDYLFKGYAEAFFDPTRAIENLNEVVKRSHSPLARAVRADVRITLAEDRSDAQEAEGALADVRAAKEYLTANPFVLAVSVQTHIIAANIFAAAGRTEQQTSALEVAKNDATALEPWEALPYPALARWAYFEHAGQEAASLASAGRAAAQSASPVFAYRYALALYRQNALNHALRVLDERKRTDVSGDCLRAFIVAELHPDDRTIARAAYEELAKRYSSGSSALYPQNVLLFLGDKQGSVAASRALRKQDSAQLRYGNLKRLLNYYCGDLTNAELIQGSARSKWSQCDAHFAIALSHLAEGDRAAAREHFQRAAATRLIAFAQCDWSRAFLARLERHSGWPPWIPVKDSH
jgi:serine/threonine protein kinase